jgi:murein DD-endopeptidase MepM/ murein hydrolase activator NlpD
MNAFALTFLQASVTCTLAGLVLWSLLKLAARVWPALAMQRSVWLLSQTAIGACFVIALLPNSAQFSVLPAIEISRAATQAAAMQDGALDAGQGSDDIADSATVATLAQAWLPPLARAWLALYCAGLLLAATRLMLAQRGLRGLLASSHRLGTVELEQHPAFDVATLRQLMIHGLPVFETDAPISPMLVGLGQPRLLLPRHLRSFSTEQQQLIVAHELTHWRRQDPLLLHASICLQTVFWFNPVLRALGRQLNWAQELSCDQQVLAGRPQTQRQQYAAALVSQLKLQQAVYGASSATLAFGNASVASLGERVRLIRQSGMARTGMLAKAAVLAMLAALLMASMALQPAFAWREPLAADATAVARPVWQQPLESVRVTSFFGVKRNSAAKTHRGIDFAARTGTPVLAAADGKVVEVTDRFDGEPGYGKVIVIEHANRLRSVYAHLDSRSVKVGESLRSGQVIGLSGATGKVTGPHLHLEVFEDGRRIDPARLIAGLDENATTSAL